MKKFLLFISAYLLLINAALFSQTEPPKYEFRGAWLSTVANIDWPSSPGNSVEKNKQDLIKILDYLKAANLNAVVFQIRPACDAMYKSEIEPWSYWLTGLQGKAPNPVWDPLEFAVEEAHKRGMELHAWFNPYRVRWSTWGLTLDPKNVAVRNPSWVLTIAGSQILDPGIPQVRDHVLNVIMDVVRRYDVDAIHFDDYFYMQEITNEDDKTFAEHNPKGFTDRGDWRRDNVNELLRMIYAGIQAEKPHVKFGQSPSGIWKSGVPPGIFGRSAYSAIFCDAVAWLDEQIIDYLTPQLYWPFGGGQDYGKLLPWWAEQRNGRHIIPGLPFYQVGNTAGMDKTQLGKMITLNRNTDGVYGEIYFTSNDFEENKLNNTDTLKNNYYRYKAIVPPMEWKELIPPSAPADLRFDRVPGLGTTAITWTAPPDDDVARYVLYSFDDADVQQNSIDNASGIFDITSKNYYLITDNVPDESKYYVVTALDHNNNESVISNVFQFQPNIAQPDQPELQFPLAGSNDAGDTVIVVWNYAQNASTYHLQVSKDNSFTSTIVNADGIVDTFYQFTGLNGETEYFWRVKAKNLAGESGYSQTFSFTTAFPAAPALIYPTDVTTNIELDPTFQWSGRPDADNYTLELFEGLSILQEALVYSVTVQENQYHSPELKPGTFYSWHVSIENSFGISEWASPFKFKTIVILPDTPSLLLPVENDQSVPDSVILSWTASRYALTYSVWVAEDANFTNTFYSATALTDTAVTVRGLKGETTYYWRVRAVNNGGQSAYSETRSFFTGFPVTPSLIYPGDLQTEVELTPAITWSSTKTAAVYHLQLSQDVNINPAKMIADTLVADTVFTTPTLLLNTIYSWRVKAKNNLGESGWTSIYKFKTVQTVDAEETTEVPKEYYLYQNYPNPFNPSTQLKFDLPKEGLTTLRIYNILGQQIAELINDNLKPGRYSIEFNSAGGTGLPSGIYFYVLHSGEKKFSKKMILVK